MAEHVVAAIAAGGSETEIIVRRPIVTELLPVELTNRNDGQGYSWHRTATEKKQLRLQLNHLKRKPFNFRIDVVLTRILGKGQRFFDPDSIGRGNAKQIVDALTGLGWWVDDSAKHIDKFDYRQNGSQRENGPKVLIEIYQAET